jgi:cell division protein FtsB
MGDKEMPSFETDNEDLQKQNEILRKENEVMADMIDKLKKKQRTSVNP